MDRPVAEPLKTWGTCEGSDSFEMLVFFPSLLFPLTGLDKSQSLFFIFMNQQVDRMLIWQRVIMKIGFYSNVSMYGSTIIFIT